MGTRMRKLATRPTESYLSFECLQDCPADMRLLILKGRVQLHEEPIRKRKLIGLHKKQPLVRIFRTCLVIRSVDALGS